jgi:hypothetical protein
MSGAALTEADAIRGACAEIELMAVRQGRRRDAAPNGPSCYCRPP